MKHIFVQTLHAVYMSNFIRINLDLGISKREETEAKHNRLLVCAELYALLFVICWRRVMYMPAT